MATTKITASVLAAALCCPSVVVAGCTTDIDCSLNGVCNTKTNICDCDLPWSGDACDTMGFLPVTFPQGYGMTPNVTTWGGNIIYDKASKTHHMFASRMTNDCPLDNWGQNSRIDHAVSETGPTGPYFFKDVAINTWAHNAAPIVLKDGSYAIVHIGTGTGSPDGGKNCTPNAVGSDVDAFGQVSSPTPREMIRSPIATNGGSTIHVSKSLDGPWEPLTTSLGSCNNPAPWVHSNGTIYIGCGGNLKRADNLAGPYTTVANFPTGGGPDGHYEDPQVYIDFRGNWHCLYHVYTTNLPSFNCVNSTVSAHAFSEDGLTWQISKVSPYGTQVELSNGTTVTVATRERPKVFFDSAGRMTHLLNGVCGSAMCATPKTHAGCVDCKYAQWDYTLITPLVIH